MHEDVTTVMGASLREHVKEAYINNTELTWQDPPKDSLDMDILTTVSKPFSKDGGLTVLSGPLGRGVIKTSAVKDKHHKVTAPAIVFNDQDAMLKAFKAGELNKDAVIIVRFQGPSANGMPELHKLTPSLGVLQDKGFKVALVTDGRMSGASGKVPAAIHIAPEAAQGGGLARVQDGDIVTLNAVTGELLIDVDPEAFAARPSAAFKPNQSRIGFGRDLFGAFRQGCASAETGAGIF